MTGIKTPSPWYGWAATLREIREGEPPHMATIAEALRGTEPVPDEVRAFLSDFIIGAYRLPRGRPRNKNVIEQEIDERFLRYAFEFEYECVKYGWQEVGIAQLDQPTVGTPYEIALERTVKVAAKHGMHLSVDQLKKRVEAKG